MIADVHYLGSGWRCLFASSFVSAGETSAEFARGLRLFHRNVGIRLCQVSCVKRPLESAHARKRVLPDFPKSQVHHPTDLALPSASSCCSFWDTRGRCGWARKILNNSFFSALHWRERGWGRSYPIFVSLPATHLPHTPRPKLV